MMRIYLGADHAGLELKNKIFKALLDKNFAPEIQKEVHDLGPQSVDPVDYPDFANQVCKKIHGFSLVSNEPTHSHPPEVGILVCGSGQGMAIRANKFPHIRAALCWDENTARLSREHNDANVLCLGGRVLDHDLALRMVGLFLTTAFAGGRHQQRVIKLNQPV